MGTRHLIAVVEGGDYKVAQYGQWDGYPDGQGYTILDFFRTPGNETRLRKGLENCDWAEANTIKTLYASVGIQLNDTGMITYEQSKIFAKAYPTLHRDTGAEILEIIASSTDVIPLKDSRSFGGESLFCEWVYVIDLDNNTLEVYKGFRKDPSGPADRFHEFEDSNEEYKACRIEQVFHLNNLPTNEEFLSHFVEEEEEDDD